MLPANHLLEICRKYTYKPGVVDKPILVKILPERVVYLSTYQSLYLVT